MLQLRNTEFVEKQLILIEKMKGPNFIEKYFIIIQKKIKIRILIKM